MYRFQLAPGVAEVTPAITENMQRMVEGSKLSGPHLEEVNPNSFPSSNYEIKYAHSPKLGVVGAGKAASPRLSVHSQTSRKFSTNSIDNKSSGTPKSDNLEINSSLTGSSDMLSKDILDSSPRSTDSVMSDSISRLSKDEYEVKFTEARFQLTELNSVLDKMLSDGREYEQKFNKTMSNEFGINTDLDIRASCYSNFDNASVKTTKTMKATGTALPKINKPSNKGNLLQSKEYSALMSLNRSIGSLEYDQKLLRSDILLAEFLNQAVTKSKRLSQFYHSSVEKLEQNYLKEVAYLRNKLFITSQKLQAAEQKGRAYRKSGREILSIALLNGNKPERDDSMSVQDELIVDSNPSVVLDDLKDYLNREQAQECVENKSKFDNESVKDWLFSEESIDYGSVIFNNSQVGEVDGVDPEVADLLVRQLRAERIENSKRIDEMKAEIERLHKRLEIAISRNRMLDSEIDEKQLQCEQLEDKLLNLLELADREAEFNMLKQKYQELMRSSQNEIGNLRDQVAALQKELTQSYMDDHTKSVTKSDSESEAEEVGSLPALDEDLTRSRTASFAVIPPTTASTPPSTASPKTESSSRKMSTMSPANGRRKSSMVVSHSNQSLKSVKSSLLMHK